MPGNNPNSQNATKVRFRANGSGPIEVSRNARSNKTEVDRGQQAPGFPIATLLGQEQPKHDFAAAGAGWEPLMRFGQTTIADKIVFGTGAFLMNRPYSQLCDEMRSLPIKPDVLEAWLWRNAARLLKLTVGEDGARSRV